MKFVWQISYPPANGESQGNYFLPKRDYQINWFNNWFENWFERDYLIITKNIYNKILELSTPQ